jgi:AraC-like DNA-binding protein
MLYFNLNDKSIINYYSSGKTDVIEYEHIWRTLDQCQLFFVISGDLYIKEGNEEFHLKSGDYLITRPGVYYGGYKASTSIYHWNHFTFYENSVSFTDQKNDSYDYSIPRYGHLKEWDMFVILFVLLEQYCAYPEKKFITNKINLVLLLELINNVTCTPLIITSKDKRFQPIMDYFNHNPYYNEFTDVKSMAEFFGYSEKYLIRIFKKNTGKSPMQYFIDKKVMRAEELLSDTTLSVKEIAEKLNYDYYYFLRLFKKRTGISPTKFRKSVIPNWKNYLK